MKPTLPLLAVSLAANAALLAFVLLRSPAPTEPGNTPGSSASPTPALVSRTGALSSADAAALARSREILATDDMPTLVARLRAAGFSLADIHAIVLARLNQIYGARNVAIAAQQATTPYWRAREGEDPRIFANYQEVWTQSLKLVGDKFPGDPYGSFQRQRQYDYLPSDKIDRLEKIQRDYIEMQNALFRDQRGITLPEDQAKIDLLEKEKLNDIAKLLTPEELEAYQLRTSDIANRLRDQLTSFKPSEEEFLALYRLNQKSDQLMNLRPLPAALQQQLEAALGVERAADYLQSTDFDYKQTDRLVTRLELPSTVVPQVYSLQRDFQQRMQTISKDRSLSPGARQAALGALADEADEKFPALLGERGYAAYRSSIGTWLINLKTQSAKSGTGGK